jgi:multidrug efflux pump subunit AcrA (membrane-fusion protein)
MKRILWITLSVLLLSGMGYSIFNLVTRDSPTTPRPLDRSIAERVIVAPAGSPEAGTDLSDPVMTSGAGLAVGTTVIGGNGVIEPDREEVGVSGQVAGRIAEVLVKEGDKVSADAPLLRLDDAVQRATVAIAEADLETAKVRRDRTLAGSRSEDIRASIAQVREAQARANLSRGVFERLEKLAASNAATADELDRARRQADADRFATNAAEARRSAVVNGSRAEDIAEAEALVKAAEARLLEAQARLDELTIRRLLSAWRDRPYRARRHVAPHSEGRHRRTRLRSDPHGRPGQGRSKSLWRQGLRRQGPRARPSHG